MILSVIQLISCIVLALIAIKCAYNKTASNICRKTLFPYILFAGSMGIYLGVPYLAEVFVALYSGTIYDIEAAHYRLTGPYWWAYGSGLLLPLLPWLGLIPWVGKKPILMAILAFLAMIPRIISVLFS